MLAQSFQSAADLGITEPQKDALIKTLKLMETGKIDHFADDLDGDVMYRKDRKFSGLFNMVMWAGDHECGTVCCIGGTAELIGNVTFGADFGQDLQNSALEGLFCPREVNWRDWRSITPAQAARALRSYLTTGDAKWSEAVA